MATAHRTLPLAATVLWLCLLPHAEGPSLRQTTVVLRTVALGGNFYKQRRGAVNATVAEHVGARTQSLRRRSTSSRRSAARKRSSSRCAPSCASSRLMTSKTS